jgi:hypothetical protein
MSMTKKHSLKVVTLFNEFLQAFGRATPDERRAFLDYISPQSRADLINLADVLRQKESDDDKAEKNEESS